MTREQKIMCALIGSSPLSLREIAWAIKDQWLSVGPTLKSMEKRGLIRKASTTKPVILWEIAA